MIGLRSFVGYLLVPARGLVACWNSGCYRGLEFGVPMGRVFWLFKLIEYGQIDRNGQS